MKGDENREHYAEHVTITFIKLFTSIPCIDTNRIFCQTPPNAKQTANHQLPPNPGIFNCSDVEKVLFSGKSLLEKPRCATNSPLGRTQVCCLTSQ